MSFVEPGSSSELNISSNQYFPSLMKKIGLGMEGGIHQRSEMWGGV